MSLHSETAYNLPAQSPLMVPNYGYANYGYGYEQPGAGVFAPQSAAPKKKQ